MAIHTSAMTYRRGIPDGYTNFFFVAQANNTIIAPMGNYLRGFKFYGRNIVNGNRNRWPWKP
jgi:hypothetical protein